MTATEKQKQYFREYYDKNKERLKERAKQYRIDNPEKVKQTKRTYAEAHKGQRKEYLSTKRGKASALLRAAKFRAQQSGLDFDLELDDISIPDVCPLLDVPIRLDCSREDKHHAPSLDRIDNTKGYVKGNVAVVSHRANAMKRDASKEELLEFAKHIMKYVSFKD